MSTLLSARLGSKSSKGANLHTNFVRLAPSLFPRYRWGNCSLQTFYYLVSSEGRFWIWKYSWLQILQFLRTRIVFANQACFKFLFEIISVELFMLPQSVIIPTASLLGNYLFKSLDVIRFSNIFVGYPAIIFLLPIHVLKGSIVLVLHIM